LRGAPGRLDRRDADLARGLRSRPTRATASGRSDRPPISYREDQVLNSLLIAVLAAVDVYYIHTDVMLLARLAGAAEPAAEPAPVGHARAVIVLCSVVAVWVVRRLLSRK
jgi:hypothetical protein